MRVSEGAFTKRKLSHAITGEKAIRMLFLLKCAIAILLVCVALEWRVGGPEATTRARQGATMAHAKAPPKSVDGKALSSIQDQASEAGAALMRAGADALARAARDKCAASPADCIEIARRLHAESGRRQ